MTTANPSIFAACCPADAVSCVPARSLPWLRLAIGLFVAAQTMILGLTINLTPPDDRSTALLLQLGMLAATLVVLLLLGAPLALEAFRQLRIRRLTMELLFLAGILAAFAISCQSILLATGPVYFEVVNILLVVYSVGHAINSHSRTKALSSIQSFTQNLSTARLISPTQSSPVPASSISPGDLVRVLPGELIPIDGTITAGLSLVRQTPFTGESISTFRRPGDPVLAGTLCEDGSLLIRATSPGSDRRVDRLTQLIDSARQSPTTLQRQADRFVQWFLPIVAFISLATFLFWTWRIDWHRGLFNALAVVLVACPCAAGLATPLVIWSLLARLASRGLIFRTGDAIERLASIDSVIFDKTGTLGDENLTIREIQTPPDPALRATLLALIATLEQHSSHPVALALRTLPIPKNLSPITVLSLRTLPGQGIEADIQTPLPIMAFDGLAASAASSPHTHYIRLTRDPASTTPGTLTLQLFIDAHHAATIILAERLRDSASQTLSTLQSAGLPVQVMTGDSPAGASDAAQLAPTLANLTPEQKHHLVCMLRDDPAAQFRRPLFVGDGINDAAAMAASHVSIALATGSEIALETASATLYSPDLTLIPHAIALSRRAIATIRSNLHWAVFYNLVGILFAASGLLHPVLASLLMACSSLLVSYRSLHLAESLSDLILPPRRMRSEATPRISSSPQSLLYKTPWQLAHFLGLFGQAALLIPLANLSPLAAIAMILFSVALFWLLLRLWRYAPPWLDMTLAMLTLGGLGMNLGWWIDMGFGSAMRNGAVHHCCAASQTSSSHWMYWGMLLLGVPAMYLLRRTPESFSLRRWCCVGPLLLGVPGMCFGMWVGGLLASHLTAWQPSPQILASYVLMMLGMAIGMLVPHSLEILFPVLGGSESGEAVGG